VATDGLCERLKLGRRLRVHHLHECRQVLWNGGREELADAPPDDLFAGDAGMLLIRIVHFEDPPIRGDAPVVIEQLVECKAFRHVLEEQPVLLLTRSQRPLCPDALGYVKPIDARHAECGDHMDRLREDRAPHLDLAPEARLILVIQLAQDCLEISRQEGAHIAWEAQPLERGHDGRIVECDSPRSIDLQHGIGIQLRERRQVLDPGFAQLARRDVEKDAAHPDGPALIIICAPTQRADPANPPIREDDAILALQFGMCIQRKRDALLGRLAIIGMENRTPGIEGCGCGLPIQAEEIEGLCRPIDATGLDVPIPRPGAGRSLRILEARDGLLQPGLSLTALGDVLAVHGEPADISLDIQDRIDMGVVDPAVPLIHKTKRLAGLQDVFQVPRSPFLHLRRKVVERGGAHQLSEWGGQAARGRFIGGQDVAAVVQQHRGFGQSVHQRAGCLLSSAQLLFCLSQFADILDGNGAADDAAVSIPNGHRAVEDGAALAIETLDLQHLAGYRLASEHGLRGGPFVRLDALA